MLSIKVFLNIKLPSQCSSFPAYLIMFFLKQNFLDVYLKSSFKFIDFSPPFLVFAFFKKENRSLALWNFPYPEFY